MEKATLLKCVCGSNEHIMILDYDKKHNQIYLSIHLRKLRWYERFITAIKYIFGYTCKFGNFEELIIDETNVEEFKKTLNSNIL